MLLSIKHLASSNKETLCMVASDLQARLAKKNLELARIRNRLKKERRRALQIDAIVKTQRGKIVELY